jgi:probable HAF family extracellular repeat protein
MQDLGDLDGLGSDAFGINERGDVVGFSQTSTGLRAVIWRAGTGMQALGTLGGTSAATAIDARGLVVGYSLTPMGSVHAVAWQEGPAQRDRAW